MEKTYKVTIKRERRVLGHIIPAYEHLEMTIGQVAEARAKVSDWIVSDFRWEDYPSNYTHLVYCVRMGDEFIIWPYGYLLDERTFHENVADRQGAGQLFDRVWAYHKC